MKPKISSSATQDSASRRDPYPTSSGAIARTLGFGAMASAIMTVLVMNAFSILVSAIAGAPLFCDSEMGDPIHSDP